MLLKYGESLQNIQFSKTLFIDYLIKKHQHEEKIHATVTS